METLTHIAPDTPPQLVDIAEPKPVPINPDAVEVPVVERIVFVGKPGERNGHVAEPVAAEDYVSPGERSQGAWFADDPDYFSGRFVIDDEVHQPATILFADLPDALADEVENLPLKTAEMLGISIEQAGNQEWLNRNVQFEKALPFKQHVAELYQRVRAAAVKDWTFEREVTPENIEKLPRKVKLGLAEHIIAYTQGGDAETVFFPG